MLFERENSLLFLVSNVLEQLLTNLRGRHLERIRAHLPFQSSKFVRVWVASAPTPWLPIQANKAKENVHFHN